MIDISEIAEKWILEPNLNEKEYKLLCDTVSTTPSANSITLYRGSTFSKDAIAENKEVTLYGLASWSESEDTALSFILDLIGEYILDDMVAVLFVLPASYKALCLKHLISPEFYQEYGGEKEWLTLDAHFRIENIDKIDAINSYTKEKSYYYKITLSPIGEIKSF